MIDEATREAPIQGFLEENPGLLIQHLGGGHGRWVIPQKRLGAEFIPDFIIGEKSSAGYEWYLVELESPCEQAFTKAGDQSAALSHALNQIQRWRAWLGVNQNYAARPRREGGLDLLQISASPPGLVLMGRRSEVSDETNTLRRQIASDARIAIHTYDFLIESVAARFESR